MMRGGRLVPARVDIDPRGLNGVLGQAFVLERIATGLARFRVAGSHLGELMGLEVRGMPLSSIFVPEARQTLADAIQSCFDDPAVIRIRLAAEGGFGRQALSGEMILLPLRSDLGDITRALGAVQMTGKIGRAPRRLSVVSQTRRGLTGYAADARGLGDPCPKPETRPDDGPVRHLRLVADNTRSDIPDQ
jgi:hypothetical protein